MRPNVIGNEGLGYRRRIAGRSKSDTADKNVSKMDNSNAI